VPKVALRSCERPLTSLNVQGSRASGWKRLVQPAPCGVACSTLSCSAAHLPRHLPSLFHLGSAHGVFPCRVCSHCKPDAFRFAVPFLLLLAAPELWADVAVPIAVRTGCRPVHAIGNGVRMRVGSLARRPVAQAASHAAAGFALVSPALLPVLLMLPSAARQHRCWSASTLEHKRCRSRIACTSLKDAWHCCLLNFARELAPACVASVVLSSGLRLCCTSPTDRLCCITRGCRCLSTPSLAVRFKGFSPQRARGRERLSHR
jgi:hypothetical protein